MERSCGITLITLILSIAKVCGQACPEGSNVVQMCVPGSYSGESVLIDTTSYNPSISNCSCTFGTTSSIIKLVTYVAPNYPECNSAVRLYSSSGNSIRFQCLMSGTYLDTSVYNAGVATFEKYGDIYDRNYCLMLEIAGRIGDIVTVTCTGDEATAHNNIATNVVKDTLETLNDTINTAYNTNDNTSDNSTDATPSLPLTELSTIDSPDTKTETTVEASEIETTSTTTPMNKTENQVDLSNIDVSTKDIMIHTRGENFTETSKTDILTTTLPLVVTTSNSSDGHIFESNVNDTSQLKQDMVFIDSGFDNFNASSNVSDIVIVGKIHNTTDDTLELLEGAGTYRREEIKPIDTVTAIVTGTVLFNGGGTNSSKTIQTIGAVLSDSLPVQSDETPVETTTSKIENYVSSSSLNIEPSKEASEFLLVDMPGITQPTDVSNLLVMESNSSNSKSEMTNAASNTTDNRSSDYSLQFPSFGPSLSLPLQNNASNRTYKNFSEINTSYTGINASLSMKTNLEATIFMNSSETNLTDTITENNTLFNKPLEANGLSIKMTWSDAQRRTTDGVISQVNFTVGAQNKSHFTTREIRMLMENTEPTDVVGNITNRSILPTENTTDGNVTMRSILPSENTTDKITRDFSVSSMEGNHGASSTGSISKGGMEINSLVTESPDFTKTTLGTELKGTDSFLTNLVNDTLTVSEQTTPVQVSYESFTTAQSVFESTGKSGLTNTTQFSENTEEIIMNPTVGNEVPFNDIQPMFGSTGKSDLLSTTTFGKTTEEIIVNPTVLDKVSSNHIPTTPSLLDLVYMQSSVTTLSSNTDAHSKATSPVPITTLFDAPKEASIEEHNSFGVSSYHISEKNSIDPTASASINESLNLTETVYEVKPDRNTTTDEVTHVHNSNVSFSDANLTEVLLPSMNETNINFLSSIQRINSSKLNLNESIMQLETQNQYDSSVMPKDNATVSESNNFQFMSDTTRSLPFVKQEFANLSQAITSGATSKSGKRNINVTDDVLLSDVNISEHATDIKNNLSFVQNESVPLSLVKEAELMHDITTTFTEININEGMQETPSQSIDRMSFVQRERLPSANIKSTGGWQDITTPDTDQMAFVHRDSAPFTDKNSIGGWQETSTKRTDQTLFVQPERLPSAEIKSTGGWQEITTPYIDQMSFVHRDRVPLADIKSTKGMQETTTQNIEQMSFVQSESLPSADIKSIGGWPDITTPYPDQMAFAHSDRVPNRESAPLIDDTNSNEGLQETSTKRTDQTSFVQRESLSSAEIKSTGGWQEITTPYPDQMAFVHRDSASLTDKNSIGGWQETSTKRTDQTFFVQRESLSSAEIKSTGGWQEITTPYIDQMSFVHRDRVPLADIKSTKGMQETTTQNIEQMSFVQSESLPSADIKTIGGLQENTSPNIDQTTFSPRDSVPLTGIKSTGRWQEITTKRIDQMSFVQRETVPMANINTAGGWQEITTQSITQSSDVYSESVPDADNKSSEISPEITTKNTKQVSSFHREYVKLAGINSTAIDNSDNSSDFNSENVQVSDPSFVEVPFDITTESFKSTSFSAKGSTPIPDSKDAQNSNETGFGTSLTERPNVSTKTTNEYVFDSGIDQHNLLVFNETHPIDIYHDTNVALQDLISQTTKDMPASTISSKLDTISDQVSSKESMHSTTGTSSTSTASITDPVPNKLTSNIPEISTAAPTKLIPTIAEEVIVHEKINREEVMTRENIPQEKTTSKTLISVSTESFVHSDILAGIENQIITDKKSKETPFEIKSTIRPDSVELNIPLATEVMVNDNEQYVKNTDIKSSDFTTTTTDKSSTAIRNENLYPDNIHPEPISPRLPSDIDNLMDIPTTPAQSFHTVEEKVDVPAEINPINDEEKTDQVGGNGMNVYFDTGSSKNSPFEMNNDTYIIVVGAIVGLVVLAVVIGILCHNSRKTRSEKVNISGEVDPSSHQNQAFDSEAADAEQGASSNGVVRDSSLPVENGGSNDTNEKEHNGNVKS